MELQKEILGKLFFNIFKDISLEQLVGMITNEYNEVMQFTKLCEDKSACQKTSLLFNPHRLNTKTLKSKSLFEAIKDERFLVGLARASLWKKDKVNELLYQTIQLGVNGIQYVNEFPPHKARLIYKENCKGGTVLDPCSGWGGRMIGASSLGLAYVGFEPATETYKGLIKLGAWLKVLNPTFNFKIINKPFEDVLLNDKYKFDFALTSPPYYNTERYSHEDTNSCNRYGTFEEWAERFLFILIYRTLSYLKDGSYFIINVGGRQYPLPDMVLNRYPHSELLDYKLSGSGGLGKDGKTGEVFIKIYKGNK